MRLAIRLILPVVLAATAADAGEFKGWQDLRVIRQKGDPFRMRSMDVDGDDRDEVVVINTRYSRLEVYDWVAADDREDDPPIDQTRPNELPMATDMKRTEIVLEQLPYDIVTADIDGKGGDELLVLVTSPNRVLAMTRQQNGEWKHTHKWNLSTSGPASTLQLLHVRAAENGSVPELLINCVDGIQVLKLAEDSRPTWFQPRESRPRADWWQADLDGDGDQDLVEWSRKTGQTLRWYESSDGRLLPPQVISDNRADRVCVLNRRNQASTPLLLGGHQDGLLRRYRMKRGDSEPLGKRSMLSFPGAAAAWTGIMIDDKSHIVIADPDHPRLHVYPVTDTGWGHPKTYPTVNGIDELTPHPVEPNTLLIRVAKGAVPLTSRWNGTRFTYPVPIESDDESDSQLVGFGRVGSIVWWAELKGRTVRLVNLGDPKAIKAFGLGEKSEVMIDVGGSKLSSVLWVPGRDLVAWTQYDRNPSYFQHDADSSEYKKRSLAKLRGAKDGEFRLFHMDGSIRAARHTNGVIQWLDDSLAPVDQVMLPGGQSIIDYVPDENGNAWALADAGRKLFRLVPDESGIQRVVDEIPIIGGRQLVRDPVLGLTLVDKDYLVRLQDGPSPTLDLVQSIDGRSGRPSGVDEATIHRIYTTDITGDGDDDVVICDDERHQLTVLELKDDKLTPLISWPVFDDSSYPYGEHEHSDLVTEPRAVIGMDIDGDGHQDLAMLCHDRLIIYLARVES